MAEGDNKVAKNGLVQAIVPACVLLTLVAGMTAVVKPMQNTQASQTVEMKAIETRINERLKEQIAGLTKEMAAIEARHKEALEKLDTKLQIEIEAQADVSKVMSEGFRVREVEHGENVRDIAVLNNQMIEMKWEIRQLKAKSK